MKRNPIQGFLAPPRCRGAEQEELSAFLQPAWQRQEQQGAHGMWAWHSQDKFPPSSCVLLVPVLKLPGAEQWVPLVPAVALRAAGWSLTSAGLITWAALITAAPPATAVAVQTKSTSISGTRQEKLGSFSAHHLVGYLAWLRVILSCVPCDGPCAELAPLQEQSTHLLPLSLCLPKTRWGRPWLTSLSEFTLNLVIMNILISSITMKLLWNINTNCISARLIVKDFSSVIVIIFEFTIKWVLDRWIKHFWQMIGEFSE